MDIRDHCACLYQKEEHCHFSNATSILSIILSFSVFQHEFHFQLFLHFTVSYHSFFLSFLSTIFFRLAIFSSNFFLFCNLKEKTIMAAIYVNFFFYPEWVCPIFCKCKYRKIPGSVWFFVQIASIYSSCALFCGQKSIHSTLSVDVINFVNWFFCFFFFFLHFYSDCYHNVNLFGSIHCRRLRF